VTTKETIAVSDRLIWTYSQGLDIVGLMVLFQRVFLRVSDEVFFVNDGNCRIDVVIMCEVGGCPIALQWMRERCRSCRCRFLSMSNDAMLQANAC
jgi:hypothetical protein